jgi:hypothetical protein
MATRVIYQPPTSAEFARLATNPKLRAALLATAERGKVIAQSLAPVESGRYADSFEVRPDTVTFRRQPRAAAVLLNTAPYAAVVETRHHVLARTRDWLGVR